MSWGRRDIQLPPQTRREVPCVLLLGMLSEPSEKSASQAVLAARGTVEAAAKSRPEGILKQIASSAAQYVLFFQCQFIQWV